MLRTGRPRRDRLKFVSELNDAPPLAANGSPLIGESRSQSQRSTATFVVSRGAAAQRPLSASKSIPVSLLIGKSVPTADPWVKSLGATEEGSRRPIERESIVGLDRLQDDTIGRVGSPVTESADTLRYHALRAQAQHRAALQRLLLQDQAKLASEIQDENFESDLWEKTRSQVGTEHEIWLNTRLSSLSKMIEASETKEGERTLERSTWRYQRLAQNSFLSTIQLENRIHRALAFSLVIADVLDSEVKGILQDEASARAYLINCEAEARDPLLTEYRQLREKRFYYTNLAALCSVEEDQRADIEVSELVRLCVLLQECLVEGRRVAAVARAIDLDKSARARSGKLPREPVPRPVLGAGLNALTPTSRTSAPSNRLGVADAASWQRAPDVASHSSSPPAPPGSKTPQAATPSTVAAPEAVPEEIPLQSLQFELELFGATWTLGSSGGVWEVTVGESRWEVQIECSPTDAPARDWTVELEVYAQNYPLRHEDLGVWDTVVDTADASKSFRLPIQRCTVAPVALLDSAALIKPPETKQEPPAKSGATSPSRSEQVQKEPPAPAKVPTPRKEREAENRRASASKAAIASAEFKSKEQQMRAEIVSEEAARAAELRSHPLLLQVKEMIHRAKVKKSERDEFDSLWKSYRTGQDRLQGAQSAKRNLRAIFTVEQYERSSIASLQDHEWDALARGLQNVLQGKPSQLAPLSPTSPSSKQKSASPVLNQAELFPASRGPSRAGSPEVMSRHPASPAPAVRREDAVNAAEVAGKAKELELELAMERERIRQRRRQERDGQSRPSSAESESSTTSQPRRRDGP
eukprot:RCo035048